MDLETDDIESAPSEFQDKYEEIVSHADRTLSKFLGLETLKEHYDVPKVDINGKSWVV